MCTSFVFYSDKTYIGMNFDISNRPITLSLKKHSQLIISQKDGPNFYPSFGLNEEGVFMNMLLVAPTEAGAYRRCKNCIHSGRLLEEVLSGRINPDSLEALFHEKTIVSVPAASVHSMVVGKNHSVCVVEPGRSIIPMKLSDKGFLVLTNFPLTDFVNRDYTEVVGDGAGRYKTCYRMLQESREAFSLERGFVTLEATAQNDGDFPTQFSMLAVPEEACVYFALKRGFHKRFKFSFLDHIIRTDEGFAHPQTLSIDRKSTLLSELAEW